MKFPVIIGYTHHCYSDINSMSANLIITINRVLEFRTPQSSLHFQEWFNFLNPHFSIKKNGK